MGAGMAKHERQLIQITDMIFLTSQFMGMRKDGTEQFNVCVRTEDGELTAMEMIVRSPSGMYSYNDTPIGSLESPEFSQYIRKFQAGPDLSALNGKPPPKDESELYQRVSEVYAETKSLKLTAKLLTLSEERTRRILFTTKDYTCETHEKIMKLFQEGNTLDEIAELAGVKRNKIHAYLPYGV